MLCSLFVQASESSNKDHGSDDDCKPLGKKSEPRNHSATRTPTKPVVPHHACAAFRFDFLHGRCSLDRVSATSNGRMTKPIDMHTWQAPSRKTKIPKKPTKPLLTPKSEEALSQSGGNMEDAKQVELWERIAKVRCSDRPALFCR